jgi:hypothetical protein
MALDPEELAEARAVVDHEQKQRRAGGDPLVGELVVRRRARDVMPFVVLLMLAPIVAGLGQPIPAAALGLATAIAFVLHGGRRVARLSIGADGSLALPGRAAIDFATLRSLELRYRYPWAASERARPHDETLDLVFELGDGSRITLARGPLWRLRPTRAPLGWHTLEAWLKTRARRSGMTIERHPSHRARAGRGFIARRPGPTPGV